MAAIVAAIVAAVGLLAGVLGGRAWLVARDERSRAAGSEATRQAQHMRAARLLQDLDALDRDVDEHQMQRIDALRSDLRIALDDPDDRLEELLEASERDAARVLSGRWP